MAKAMIRQKEGVVKPQVVAGREFKGTSFISKPEAIVFKVSVNRAGGSLFVFGILTFIFTLLGLRCWCITHTDYSFHKRFIFVQLVQTFAFGR